MQTLRVAAFAILIVAASSINAQDSRPLRSAQGVQALRGVAAEFYPAPADHRGRVRACPIGAETTQCTGRNAQAFCVRQGYAFLGYAYSQRVNGVAYLADVLCTRRAVVA